MHENEIKRLEDIKHNMKISDEQMLVMKRPTSRYRKQMSISNRSAQFAPFAALSGHMQDVVESNRVVEKKKILDENKKEQLDYKISQILQNNDCCRVIYFCKDARKDGGEYKEYVGYIKRVDQYHQHIVFTDSIIILIDDIYQIDSVEENQ